MPKIGLKKLRKQPKLKNHNTKLTGSVAIRRSALLGARLLRRKALKMAMVVLSIDEDKLPPHTKDQFKEWVEFQVGHRAEIQLSNPLNEYDIDAIVREISSR